MNFNIIKSNFNFFFSNFIYYNLFFKDINILKTKFKNFLINPIQIENNYSIIYDTLINSNSNLNLNSIFFDHCKSTSTAGCIFMSSGTLKLNHIFFYKCYSTKYSLIQCTISRLYCFDLCNFNPLNQNSIFSYVTSDSSNNSIEYFTTFKGINIIGDISYLRGGYCKFIYCNISNYYGGIGHAGYNPPTYLSIFNIFFNNTCSHLINPSSTNSGSISKCNFILNNCSLSLIYYWGSSINVNNCYFFDNIGKICFKNPKQTTNPYFSILNCYSNKNFQGDITPTNWIVNSNSFTYLKINFISCFLPSLKISNSNKFSTNIFKLFFMFIV